MKVLVTRPEPEASRTAQSLADRGYTPILAPLFTIEPVHFQIEGKIDALIITSARAVPFLESLERGTRVFVVGERTKGALELAGFTHVEQSAQDSAALTEQVKASLTAPARLLHITGEDHKDEPQASLEAAGFTVHTHIAYKAAAVAALPEAARGFLNETGGAVLHYSRRSSETLLMLARRHFCEAGLLAKTHFALSEDAAQPLRLAGAKNVHPAAAPSEEALLTMLDQKPGFDQSPASASLVIEPPKPRKTSFSKTSLIAPFLAGTAGAGLVLVLFHLFSPPLLSRLERLEGRALETERFASRLEALEQASRQTPWRAPLEALREELLKEMESLKASVKTNDITPRLEALEQRLSAPQAQAAPVSNDIRHDLAILRIDQAFRQGEAFEAPLRVVQKTNPEAAKVLEPFSKGQPAPAELIQELRGFRALIDADRHVEKGWWSRFVTVTSVSKNRDLFWKDVESALQKRNFLKAQELLATLAASEREKDRGFLAKVESLGQASGQLDLLMREGLKIFE